MFHVNLELLSKILCNILVDFSRHLRDKSLKTDKKSMVKPLTFKTLHGNSDISLKIVTLTIRINPFLLLYFFFLRLLCLLRNISVFWMHSKSNRWAAPFAQSPTYTLCIYFHDPRRFRCLFYRHKITEKVFNEQLWPTQAHIFNEDHQMYGRCTGGSVTHTRGNQITPMASRAISCKF